HIEEGGEMTITAVMLDVNHPPPEYKPKVPGGTVSNNWEVDSEAPAQLVFHTPDDGQLGQTYTAGYYRGPIYATSRARFATSATTDTNYVSIFSNKARSELIAAVDHGFIYTSTNWGLTWKAITAPGQYEFPLCTAADSSGFYVKPQSSTAPTLQSRTGMPSRP